MVAGDHNDVDACTSTLLDSRRNFPANGVFDPQKTRQDEVVLQVFLFGICVIALGKHSVSHGNDAQAFCSHRAHRRFSLVKSLFIDCDRVPCQAYLHIGNKRAYGLPPSFDYKELLRICRVDTGRSSLVDVESKMFLYGSFKISQIPAFFCVGIRDRDIERISRKSLFQFADFRGTEGKLQQKDLRSLIL